MSVLCAFPLVDVSSATGSTALATAGGASAYPSLCRAGRRRQRRCACFCKRTVRHFQDVLETVDPLVSGVSY